MEITCSAHPTPSSPPVHRCCRHLRKPRRQRSHSSQLPYRLACPRMVPIYSFSCHLSNILVLLFLFTPTSLFFVSESILFLLFLKSRSNLIKKGSSVDVDKKSLYVRIHTVSFFAWFTKSLDKGYPIQRNGTDLVFKWPIAKEWLRRILPFYFYLDSRSDSNSRRKFRRSNKFRIHPN